MKTGIPPGTALLAIVGPTAVGKSKIALLVSKEIPVEIVSVDSMQVYREMNIGTGKPSALELETVPHHMIDLVSPEEAFSVALYKRMAIEAIVGIIKRKNIPLLVGGSGLYFRAIVDDLSFPAGGGSGSTIRKYLESLSNEQLLKILSETDPVSFQTIPASNRRRILRAVEVAVTSGRVISERQESWIKYESPYNLIVAGVEMEREVLYERIDKRVEKMVSEGLIEETAKILEKGLGSGSTAAEALGYREMAAYLRGEISLEEALTEVKKKTRRYAKRQLTWFRKDPRIVWFSIPTRRGMSEQEFEDAIKNTADEVITYFRRRLDNIK